jgi:hypothetical protein
VTPAHISREATASDPEEYQAITEEARAIRASVAEQLSAMINEMDMTGSRGYLVRRLKELNAAVASGDSLALNAAVMEIAAAAGAWAAHIQLTEPAYISLRNARKGKTLARAA